MLRKIFVFAVCVLAISAEIQTEQQKYAENETTACVNETGINPLEFERNILDVAEQRRLNCLAACVLKKISIITPNNTANVNNETLSNPLFSSATSEEIQGLKSCANDVPHDDECQLAEVILSCFTSQGVYFTIFNDEKNETYDKDVISCATEAGIDPYKFAEQPVANLDESYIRYANCLISQRGLFHQEIDVDVVYVVIAPWPYQWPLDCNSRDIYGSGVIRKLIECVGGPVLFDAWIQRKPIWT